MKGPILGLLILMAADVGAEVYKCTQADGRTVYRQSPCDEISAPLDLKNTPASVIGGGLRESEKQLLEGLKQEETAPPPGPVPVDPVSQTRERPFHAQCGDIEIVSFNPYSKTVFEPLQRDLLGGRIDYGANKMQCARVLLELPGYRGRLNQSNTAEEIARRLYAQFDDGSAARGEEGSVAEGDNRFVDDKVYSGNFCFGISRRPIVDIRCR